MCLYLPNCLDAFVVTQYLEHLRDPAWMTKCAFFLDKIGVFLSQVSSPSEKISQKRVMNAVVVLR